MEGKGDTVIPSLSEASNRTGPAPSTNSHQSAPHRACCDLSDKCEMNDVMMSIMDLIRNYPDIWRRADTNKLTGQVQSDSEGDH